MPPRGRKATTAKAEPVASTMKELKDTLWKAADKLRGSMDASQYKDVILGLVFLKYVSDAFDERREQIRAELEADGMDEDQIDELPRRRRRVHGRTACSGCTGTPAGRTWPQHAKGLPGRGRRSRPSRSAQLIDEAMDLPDGRQPLAARPPCRGSSTGTTWTSAGSASCSTCSTAPGSPAQGARKARDLLGEVYEYFLEKFAKAEGKRGGEFYTPASVVRVLVEVLEPTTAGCTTRAADPAACSCRPRSSWRHTTARARDISVYGQELNERTWRMAKMNLAIHGLNGNLASPLGRHLRPRPAPGHRRPTSCMANPPFNIKDWARNASPTRAGSTACRRPATPTTPGSSTSSPSSPPAASAGVVMANGSMSIQLRRRGRDPRPARGGGPGLLHGRAADPAVPRPPASPCACGSSPRTRPPELAGRSTGPGRCCSSTPGTWATWWTAPSGRCPTTTSPDRRHFPRLAGHCVGAAKPGWSTTTKPGFCYSAALAEIKAADYALTPGRYVGAAEVEDDGEPIEEKIERLTKQLFEQFEESERLANAVRDQLDRLHDRSCRDATVGKPRRFGEHLLWHSPTRKQCRGWYSHRPSEGCSRRSNRYGRPI